MKCDFSRDTFDPARQFTRVLMQQGRVQLDADWNEQASIVNHYLRTLTRHVIGRAGGPTDDLGFGLENITSTGFHVGAGSYYVDGWLVRNEKSAPFVPPDNPEAPRWLQTAYFAYLEVWERSITYVEQPEIREVALLGPDTAARAKLVSQVKIVPSQGQAETKEAKEKQLWDQLGLFGDRAPKLRAQVSEGTIPDDPCLAAPGARYRGLENQLYRVEIHHEGPSPMAGGGGNERLVDRTNAAKPGAVTGATFKWSRENGAVIFPIDEITEADGRAVVQLAHLGRDPRFSLQVGDWVELVDDGKVLGSAVDPLFRVEQIDTVSRAVTLSTGDAELDTARAPLLRRWDQKERKKSTALSEGAVSLVEGQWLPLEDGVEIFFERGGSYRTGDYWLVPARTATGGVEWPEVNGQPVALPPRGIVRSYAPLGHVLFSGGNATLTDLRRRFEPRAAL